MIIDLGLTVAGASFPLELGSRNLAPYWTPPCELYYPRCLLLWIPGIGGKPSLLPRSSVTSGRKKRHSPARKAQSITFYHQIGRDPDEAIKAGGAAMRERFEAMRKAQADRRNPT